MLQRPVISTDMNRPLGSNADFKRKYQYVLIFYKTLLCMDSLRAPLLVGYGPQLPFGGLSNTHERTPFVKATLQSVPLVQMEKTLVDLLTIGKLHLIMGNISRCSHLMLHSHQQRNMIRVNMFRVNVFGVNILRVNMFRVNMIRVNMLRVNMFTVKMFRVKMFRVNMFKVNMIRVNMFK